MYKIEIWVYHNKVDTYENDDIQKVLIWYLKNWYVIYEHGECCFYVFKDGKEMSFEELNKIGFYG